jgi:hypothetical protein
MLGVANGVVLDVIMLRGRFIYYKTLLVYNLSHRILNIFNFLSSHQETNYFVPTCELFEQKRSSLLRGRG